MYKRQNHCCETVFFTPRAAGRTAASEEYPGAARPRGRSQEEEGRKESAPDEGALRRHRAAQAGQQVPFSFRLETSWVLWVDRKCQSISSLQ